MNDKNWKDTPQQAKRREEKFRKILNEELGYNFYEENLCKEIDNKKQKNRAGWAFLVLTIIVTSYFFVWAWTNF